MRKLRFVAIALVFFVLQLDIASSSTSVADVANEFIQTGNAEVEIKLKKVFLFLTNDVLAKTHSEVEREIRAFEVLLKLDSKGVLQSSQLAPFFEPLSERIKGYYIKNPVQFMASGTGTAFLWVREKFKPGVWQDRVPKVFIPVLFHRDAAKDMPTFVAASNGNLEGLQFLLSRFPYMAPRENGQGNRIGDFVLNSSGRKKCEIADFLLSTHPKAFSRRSLDYAIKSNICQDPSDSEHFFDRLLTLFPRRQSRLHLRYMGTEALAYSNWPVVRSLLKINPELFTKSDAAFIRFNRGATHENDLQMLFSLFSTKIEKIIRNPIILSGLYETGTISALGFLHSKAPDLLSGTNESWNSALDPLVKKIYKSEKPLSPVDTEVLEFFSRNLPQLFLRHPVWSPKASIGELLGARCKVEAETNPERKKCFSILNALENQ